MKKNKSLIKVLGISLIMFFTSSVFAQFSQLGSFMAGSTDDAEKLFGAYIAPYANGIGAGLSTGWYNSAKPHKLGGFDITISLNIAIIPTADKTFDPSALGLGEGSSSLISSVDVGTSSPTAAGKKTSGADVTYYTDIPVLGETELASFKLPKGSGFGYVPTPMLQVGVGLVKGTDLSFRYSPELSLGSGGKVGLWGIGLKHSLKQWIPALKRLPIFEMSLQGGYTKLHSQSDIDFQPSFYNDFANTVVDNPTLYSNQEMLLDISNTTVNLLLSADLKIICIYGGVGISSSKTNLKMNGYYPFPEVESSGNIIVTDATAKKDPIDISIKNSDGSVTKPRLNVGLRFKFAVVAINFDYTYANYSIASAGLGINFR